MLAWNRNGWIGIDLGAHAVKAAQLQRVGDGLRLVSASITEGRSDSLANDITAARTLAGPLRGERAAATLSMRSSRLEPTDPDAAPEKDRCLDSWRSEPGGAYTLSYPSEEIDATVDGLSQAGLHCEVIDGPPLAMARVLTLSPDYRPDELIGAIDWGETAITFVAAQGGQATYTRRLGSGGYHDLRTHVQEDLGLHPSEANRLLTRYRAGDATLGNEEDRLVQELLRDAIRPLARELKRTLEHLGGKLKSKPPQRCFLLGVGGSAPSLSPLLAALAGVRVEPWHAVGIDRNPSLHDLPDCLLAQAIALSALAWETRG